MTPDQIRRIRAELGLSQQALADELGVNRVTVAKWEAGMRNISKPTARLLLRIAAERRQTRSKRSHRKGKA